MQLPPSERVVAIGSVPMHLQPIVSDYIKIAETFEKREIENHASSIAGIGSKDGRRAALAKVRDSIRDRVRERAMVLYEQRKSTKAGGEQ
jgi:hypothetical protein